MIGITSLDVYNSIFTITEQNNKFDFYTDIFDEFSSTELKDELEEILKISNTTENHLEYEILGPRINKTLKKLETEKRQTDGYIIILMGYARSPFRDLESYLRIVIGLDEDDIHLIFKQYNANFFNYKLSPGIYSIEDIPKVVYLMGDHEGTLQIEHDDVIMQTKMKKKRISR